MPVRIADMLIITDFAHYTNLEPVAVVRLNKKSDSGQHVTYLSYSVSEMNS